VAGLDELPLQHGPLRLVPARLPFLDPLPVPLGIVFLARVLVVLERVLVMALSDPAILEGQLAIVRFERLLHRQHLCCWTTTRPLSLLRR